MNIIETNLSFGNMDKRKTTKRAIFHNSGVTVRQPVEVIHNYHKSKGWAGIGYHLYIRRDGSVYRGRPEQYIGAHATGSNSDSLGICFEGNLDEEEMTIEQINAGKEVVAYIKSKYGDVEFTEHRKVCNTSCPGANFKFDEIVGCAGNVEVTNTSSTSNNATESIATIQSTLNSRYGLNIAVDNLYGKETKKALIKGLQTELNNQFGKGLCVDGIFGPKTKEACVNVRKGATGNITYILQAMLYCKGYNTNGVDGIFGSGTENAVRQFQKTSGLSVDGIAGKNTFSKLFA